jgi:hypothetical protein
MLFTCYEEVQAVRENDLENSLKIYTLMGSKKFVQHWRSFMEL